MDDANTGLETGDEPVYDSVQRQNIAVTNRHLHRKIYSLAVAGKNYEIIDILISNCADPYIADKNGNSAKSIAAQFGDLTLMKRLVKECEI